MEFLNVRVNVKNTPELEQGFIPFEAFIRGYLKTAKKPLSVAVFRNRSLVSVYDTFVNGSPDLRKADFYYIERLVKLLLWMKGGARVEIYGDDGIAEHIAKAYSKTGARAFDAGFMARVYGREFTVEGKPLGERPEPVEENIHAGGNWNGCRIGFDAGGSDRKVSAVVDGEAVYSEEVVWNPKTQTDPDYHYDGIVSAMKAAASKMPRVDAIGVSSAGIYIDNRTAVASLFIRVPGELFDQKARDIYIRAAKEIGDVPLVVANDGDVTALAGAESLDSGKVLGVAMGTSEAAGYVNGQRGLNGWLNELAFVPVDCSQAAMRDEWSGDIGCGVKYFSQDGINKLAEKAGIDFGAANTPAEKLKAVQKLMEKGDARAESVYRSTGVQLGHTIALYARFYDLKHVLLLGRVMSGDGGAIIENEAKRVLAGEYPEIAMDMNICLPDERMRRVGQSVAAAGLPAVEV